MVSAEDDHTEHEGVLWMLHLAPAEFTPMSVMESAAQRAAQSRLDILRALRERHWHGYLHETLRRLMHRGYVQNSWNGYGLTRKGTTALQASLVSPRERQIIAGFMRDAFYAQNSPRRRMQDYVDDMRRGRPPRWR